jgi:imidazolonepropionase-like amidohydrolase
MKLLLRTTFLAFGGGALLAHAAPAQEMVAIKAGRVITITHGELSNAVILIEDGRIAQIGEGIEPPWNAKVIDASDKVVMPTYVLAHTSGGMSGANENMANVPYLTVQDAVDPASPFYEEALRNGVGTLHVIAGNETLIGGLGMVLRPCGRTVEDMAVRTTGGMKLSLQAQGGGRMAQIRKLRRALEEVQEYEADYNRRRAEFDKEKELGALAPDAEFTEKIDEKKKPVVDLLHGKHIAYLYVPSVSEVPEALRIARRTDFKTVLVLGGNCYKAAARFAELDSPVILAPQLEVWETDPDTDADTLHCAAAELAAAGVTFALGIDDGTGADRYPWWQMATAMRHGVSRQIALESMTTVPARILGLEKEVGSIETGKVANLQILTGDPLQATSWVETVLLEGKVVYERAKDARLLYLFGQQDAAGRASAK